jgi:PhzF family phenazine biosynthesis protein
MRIRIVDAFTDRPFAGNPAGVVLLSEEWPDDGWLQQVAAEVNLAETAFALPAPEEPGADWRLRWFTPATEVDLCGHATLATAHVLYGTGAAAGTVRFATPSGVLTVHPAGSGAITLDFPAATLAAVPAPEGLAAALGAEPAEVHATGSLGDLLAVFPDAKTVRALTPGLPAVAHLGGRGVIATAPAEDGAGHAFVSRCFYPAMGIPEDPVTGSAHTALAPYWSARLGRDELTGFQASPRGGLVRTALHGDRVHLTGHAVTVIEGDLLPEP